MVEFSGLGEAIWEKSRGCRSHKSSQLASFLVTYPGFPIVIEGHTDSVGTAQSNMVLSQRRAQSVRDWNARFRDGVAPENLEEKTVTVATDDAAIAQVLKSAGLCPSTSEALRMIEQRGVKVNGDTVADKALKLATGSTYVLQVGKRKFAKVTIKRAA